MGITSKAIIVKKIWDADKAVEVEFMIDSGAIYSLVPGKILDEIGVKTHRAVYFSLADGTKISRQVGDAYFEMEGEGAVAPVMYGEEGDSPLLGATTLEAMGLVLNPLKRELYPMKMTL